MSQYGTFSYLLIFVDIMDITTKRPPDDIWGFRLARDFLQRFRHESFGGNETISTSFSSSKFDPTSSTPESLGDFNRLYKHLGLPLDPTATSTSSTSGYSDPSTAESTPPEDASDGVAHFGELSKEVRWKDEVPGGLNLTESRRRSHNVSLADDDSDQDDIEGPGGPSTPTPAGRRARNRHKSTTKGGTFRAETSAFKSNLMPASVLLPKDDGPPPPTFSPRPTAYFERHHIRPIYTLTQTEQEAKLKRKVRRLQRSIKPTIAPASENLHVFVDCSNIIIGLSERLRLDRGMKGSVKSPPISYKSLAHVLERGRNVYRRVLVGSHNTAYMRKSDQLPAYMREARKCHYELNILEQVVKPKVTPSQRKARHGLGNGYATTSGHSSGSETFSMGAMARSEQAVDELLQMKMLESLLDSEPGTMVLASGDAAEAEYSGGFLKTVERALKKGWNVEVVAWKNGLSSEYRSASFLKKWEGRFMVIELDNFSEEMLAIYADVFPTEQALY